MMERPDLEKLAVIRYPDPLLKKPSVEITEVDSFLDELVCRMAELMEQERGMGLAGPQVGLNYRIVIGNPTMEPGKYEVLINPVILKREGRLIGQEGCLSVPGVFANVKRAERVVVRAMRPSGETVEFEAEGLPARLWQHEIDHLDGALFVDRLSTAARILIRNSLKELERAYERDSNSGG